MVGTPILKVGSMDFITLLIFPIVSFVVKLFVKPSTRDVKNVTKLLSWGIVLALELIKKTNKNHYNHKHLSNYIQGLKDSTYDLISYVGREKIEVG